MNFVNEMQAKRAGFTEQNGPDFLAMDQIFSLDSMAGAMYSCLSRQVVRNT
jgi:hypothetical protein